MPSLGLAAGEQRRAVRARQHADLRHDRPHRLEIASVNTPARVKNVPPHDLGFELLENCGDPLGVVACILHAVREEMRHHGRFRRIHGRMARHLIGNGVGGSQLRLDQAEHFLFQLSIVHLHQFARLLGCLFGKTNDGLDHRLEVPVAEHDGAQHDFFGKFLCLGFDHQHRVLGAGNHEVEVALGHLVDLRIENVFVVDEADAGGAHRPHERHAGERQGRGCRHHRYDIRIIFLIVRHACRDNLGIAAPAVREQRTNRAIHQPRHQGLAFGRAPLALEIAARNAAGCEESFLVVAGQRHEIDAFLRLLRRHNGCKDGGLAVAGEYCSVRLSGYFAGFENELAPAPIKFFTMDVKHWFRLLSWFAPRMP